MTMVGEKRAANAVGGKTARACDSCLRRRARWYCAADDAFLCQVCDTSVHSANPLARRHERVRLKTTSLSSCSTSSSPVSSSKPATAAADSAAPSWHQGFKRKARTPRPHQATKPAAAHQVAAQATARTEPLVPDFEATSLDENAEEEEEQLLYRVPIFDPVLAEFCSGHVSDDSTATTSSPAGPATTAGETKSAVEPPKYASSPVAFANALPGFSPSDVDIGDFAVDVESLLGRGLDEDAFCMEGLGLMDAGGDVTECCLGGGGHVKLETSDGDEPTGINGLVAARMVANGETFDLNFDCGSPAGHPDEEETKAAAPASAAVATDMCGEAAVVPGGGSAKRRVKLRLDYEAVIDAWSSTQGCSSPWADGERPQLNTDECWPDYMGMWGAVPGVVYTGGGRAGGEVGGAGGESGSGVAHGATGDGGREARVSRYREKRRTRLFSKKIRYEVRKLNAEKRPRMKGRFVKSASFVAAAAAVGGGIGMGVGVGVAPLSTFAF